jgi:hypothetical protein
LGGFYLFKKTASLLKLGPKQKTKTSILSLFFFLFQEESSPLLSCREAV